MDTLIPVFNKIQDVFHMTGSSGLESIQLPQIVVVGSQSSGKSSVLESLVGRSFLPRGSGIVTRCPIILQLIHVNDDDPEYKNQSSQGNEEWCVFLHSPTKIYTDFDKVREEIESETSRMAGDNRGISDTPISLKIYSKNVLNLTLVDLPGLVKVPSGDQPEDIEDQINDLVMTYINNPNSIILAVSPANNDIATSESLKFAKQLDPTGSRTLAVITKLDLMDAGTNARDVLSGRILPVKLGIIGVVNRSQQDIADNKSIAKGIEAEAFFLRTYYSTLANTNGIPYLAKRLNRILMEHYSKCLPALEARMHNLMLECQTTLKMLKDEGDSFKVNEMLSEILIKFNNAYCASIQGRPRHISTEKLSGGALIDYAFNETFFSDMNEVEPIVDVTESDIIVAIRNSKGIESKLFVPEDAANDLVKKQILRLKKPALDCANNVEQSLRKIIEDCIDLPELSPYMERFPFLSSTISTTVRDVIIKRLAVAQDILTNYVDVKASFVHTKRPEYMEKIVAMKGMDVLAPRLGSSQMGGSDSASSSRKPFSTDLHEDKENFMLNENQKQQCEMVRGLMDAYFRVIKSDCMDHVPQALAHAMVYYLADNLQQILLTSLFLPEKMDKLMQESETIAIQRTTASSTLKALEKATALIAEVRESNF